jgi:hypothetical protein
MWWARSARVCARFAARPPDRASPSSKPGHRHMDSDKAEQHDTSRMMRTCKAGEMRGRSIRAQYNRTPRSTTSRMRPTTAPIMGAIDLGSAGISRSAAGTVRPSPAAGARIPRCGGGAVCRPNLFRHTVGAVNGALTAELLSKPHPLRSRLAASASSAALSFLKTASMASGSRIASSSSPASTSS